MASGASHKATSFGMMDGAYFVGRQELLNWINGFLGSSYKKVEETASGAAVCQIFEALHPGSLPLSKVNFEARQEYQFASNYKVLQAAFNKLRIDKHIDVNRLIKGRYQDNLEFLQWVKAYFDRNSCGDEVAQQVEKPQARAAPGKRTQAPVPAARRQHNKENLNRTAVRRVAPTSANSRPAAPIAPGVSQAEFKIATEKVKDLQFVIEELEKERDFYFGKLRDIEILCQTTEEQEVHGKDSELLKEITGILYANDEEDAGGEAAQVQELVEVTTEYIEVEGYADSVEEGVAVAV